MKSRIASITLWISSLLVPAVCLCQFDQAPTDNLTDGLYAVFLPHGGTYAIDIEGGGSWYQTAMGNIIHCTTDATAQNCTHAMQFDENLKLAQSIRLDDNPRIDLRSVRDQSIVSHNCHRYTHSQLGETCMVIISRSSSGAPDYGQYTLCLTDGNCIKTEFIYRPVTGTDTELKFDRRVLNPDFLLSMMATT